MLLLVGGCTPPPSPQTSTGPTSTARQPSATPTIVAPPPTVPGEAARYTWDQTELVGSGRTASIKSGRWGVSIHCVPLAGARVTVAYRVSRGSAEVVGGTVECGAGRSTLDTFGLPDSSEGSVTLRVEPAPAGQSSGYAILAPERALLNG